MSDYPPIDVWRMSASRPWHLRTTSPGLFDKLKYSGELRFHLIESVLVEELSEECIQYASSLGYTIHVIRPAAGQGRAIRKAVQEVIATEFSLKWEDDFKAEKDIPLDNCVDTMLEHSHVNQICFNKRETMSHKTVTGNDGQPYEWPKEQRLFSLRDGREVPLVVRERWWFGASMWRMSYVEEHFVYYDENIHNYLNDHVLLPLAGYRSQNPRYVPTPSEIEKRIGCYIYGRTEDMRMVEHVGVGDSIYAGEFKEKMQNQGYRLIGS